MTAEQPYTPGPNAARHTYAMRRSTGTGGPTITAASAEFDRFIAQVRRDAAREALDGLAATHDAQVLADFGLRNSSRIGQEARIYRDTHYPEETS